MTVPTISLGSGGGVAMPQLGFGVARVPPDDTANVVACALDVGYRRVDTAQMYGNEAGVGQALVRSGLAREEVFITTKLDNHRHGYDEALKALTESLENLGLEYVDLFLIHWPRPWAGMFVETWQAFGKLQAEGSVRAIGVSNFERRHIAQLITETGIVPALNQVELNPFFAQQSLRSYHRARGMRTEAWSPIAKGARLADPTLTAIAEKYGKTPAQIVLRWHIQLENAACPKSASLQHMRENLDIFDFSLDSGDLADIGELDTGQRTGPHPARFG